MLSSLLDRAKGLTDIERQQVGRPTEQAVQAVQAAATAARQPLLPSQQSACVPLTAPPPRAACTLQLEALLSHMDSLVGGCERINRQPLPYAYSRCVPRSAGGRRRPPACPPAAACCWCNANWRWWGARGFEQRREQPLAAPCACRHTQRFLLVYVTILPLIFRDYYGWWACLVSAVVAFMLAGIENIGVQIEEPHRCAGGLHWWLLRSVVLPCSSPACPSSLSPLRTDCRPARLLPLSLLAGRCP